MRALVGSIAALAWLAPASASATVTEPNAQIVPINANNGEDQLEDLFAARGEPIDWRTDALSDPETFSPFCDFVAMLVLRGSSSQLPFGWYNVPPPGAPAPDASEIHEVIPCDAPLDTLINSQSIKSHSAYRGGLVGFALAFGGGCVSFASPGSIQQIHYSEKRFNVKYQNDESRPWIMSIKYNSKVTPNSFYMAFEDYLVSADGWSADGDFNDYVVFMTGLACPGGGGPCATDQPGVCGPGILACDNGQLGCSSLVTAAPNETCDGVDNDCNGFIDDGDLCTDGRVCFDGKCVGHCASGEFPCPAQLECDPSNGLCVDPACIGITCDQGQSCTAGMCKAPCDDIRCPPSLVCRLGACVDPCSGKTCLEEQICDEGVCRGKCPCSPCSGTTECHSATGRCVDLGCAALSCSAGTLCQGGDCKDACAEAVCPRGQRCQEGACIPDADGGSATGGSGGVLLDAGFGGNGGGHGASSPDAAAGSGRPDKRPLDPACACRAAGRPLRGTAPALMTLALALLALRGRARVHRSRRTTRRRPRLG